MEFKAVVDRVQWALREKGMLVFDAFRAFNSSNSGLMTCSELYGGLDFLGIPFTPDQVYDLVKKLSIQNYVRLKNRIFNGHILCLKDILCTFLNMNDLLHSTQGLVSYVDFKKVFKKSDDDLESHIAEGSSSNFEQVLPKMIPELADGNKVTNLISHLLGDLHLYI